MKKCSDREHYVWNIVMLIIAVGFAAWLFSPFRTYLTDNNTVDMNNNIKSNPSEERISKFIAEDVAIRAVKDAIIGEMSKNQVLSEEEERRSRSMFSEFEFYAMRTTDLGDSWVIYVGYNVPASYIDTDGKRVDWVSKLVMGKAIILYNGHIKDTVVGIDLLKDPVALAIAQEGTPSVG